MNYLQTIHVFLCLLLALLAGAVIASAALLFNTTDATLFLLLIPVSAVVLLIAVLMFSLADRPWRELTMRVRRFRQGERSIGLEDSSQPVEVRRLAHEIQELAMADEVHLADLNVLQRHQNEFVGSVAHEIKTPLTAIRGNAELLLDDDMDPETRRHFLESIIHESERLTRLTNDLLSLQNIEERFDASRLERIDLRALTRSTLDSLSSILNSRKAVVKVEGEAPDVLGDADALEAVISNLVANASRFIEPGGHITVELSGVHGNSVLMVKDDGCGLGDGDPHMLFARFYRSDLSRSRDTGGTGLGLSIVKSVIEAHDGKVEAFNLPEGGACFMVAIPSVTS